MRRGKDDRDVGGFGVRDPDLASVEDVAGLSSRATVCWLAASDPACSSESANAPSVSPVASRLSQACFCASVPNSAIGSATSELFTAAITEMTALARASSSIASA